MTRPAQAMKQKVLKEYGLHATDTASVSVQVALITQRLKYLNEHFSKHPKDHHSKTGLLKMVGQRKKLLRYLKNKDHDSYADLISRLGIRK